MKSILKILMFLLSQQEIIINSESESDEKDEDNSMAGTVSSPLVKKLW